ncbi:hypothetical protein HPP05_12330 [Corallococcus exiguus]|uniref:hypothetical protein n=1 Tax=Corallococcus exiguus TaxID=83462 RepID=UPI001494D3C6|nr:hypothetical protein [Corallococcus exiguus]NPC70534.1 hypothetical protein [Corallococcus exiguus]
MGDSNLISEKKFAAAFASFWRTALPLSDSFIRTLNTQRQKYTQPLDSNLPSEHNAYVSELGFRIFSALHIEPQGTKLRLKALATLEKETQDYIQSISNTKAATPSKTTRDLAYILAERIALFFKKNEHSNRLVISPGFEGCGIIDPCFGDVLCGDTLWEIKNVDRDFRAVDIRQLLTYATLAKSAGRKDIHSIGLLNAKQGFFIQQSIETVALETAQLSGSELLAGIAQFISTEQISR